MYFCAKLITFRSIHKISMKKYILDSRIISNEDLGARYKLMRLQLPCNCGKIEMLPGQFVEVKAPETEPLLRRPISIYDFDKENNILSLLVRSVGNGTRQITDMQAGERLNIVGPLGHGFTLPSAEGPKVLLIGGGVGVAPLYYLAKALVDNGFKVDLIYGARCAEELVALPAFEKLKEETDAMSGTKLDIHVCTDDGSMGFHGLVTQNPVALDGSFDAVKCCGPMPMMKAVAKLAASRGIECEVSLENHMACGLGACLCCVEKTKKGNVCVCTDGPVFNTELLSW